MFVPILLAALLSTGAGDPRDAYDVTTYRLDLRVDPDAKRIAGTSAIEVRVLAESLEFLRLDLVPELEVLSVIALEGELKPEGPLDGQKLRFKREGALIDCVLPTPAVRGEMLRVAVEYAGTPPVRDGFSGFHWKESADGSPWINTSCQGLGAHSWWPCKSSFFNPDDKHDHFYANLTVPEGLIAVTNGALTGRTQAGAGWETFHWKHDYGCDTYAITLNVGPYVVVEQDLDLTGIEGTVPFVYYVLPENAEKAAVQFKQVPELLEVFGRAFGPFPFPKSKVGLVETNFWGMEHSTAVAYGSSYPAWCKANGKEDRYARRNRFFDYILIHEMAHEWWGNALSAKHWGHFWIHEGFGTYAEAVWLEFTEGRERADEYFRQSMRRTLSAKGSIYRGDDPDSGSAYAGIIYAKGAWVLNTLRHFVNDDTSWWKALRAFHMKHRHGHADTEDFRAAIEEATGRDWKSFFDQWIYGEGVPKLNVRITPKGNAIHIVAVNESTEKTEFDLPLDLTWTENGEEQRQRLFLRPGTTDTTLRRTADITNVRVENSHRILGHIEVEVASAGS